MGAVDILDAIGAAVGCQQCGRPLGDSPSDDFCRQSCQHAWHGARADELVGCREPWDRPEDFPLGVIPPEAFEDEDPPILELEPGLCAVGRTSRHPRSRSSEPMPEARSRGVGVVPADLLPLCGIFGNIIDDDVERTVRAVPSLLAAGGTVIWTRSTRAHRPQIFVCRDRTRRPSS